MILEGFEVENWSCIRRAVVEGLPAHGVVVLHAANRTGKSSLVAALRAALFDYKPNSTDKDLKGFFPNWTDEPPRIRVDFRADGQRWRMVKQFKKTSPVCSLETWTGTAWQRVAATPAEVHDRTLELVGGKDSRQGLQQLLWLEQANIALPKEREFDTDIQSRLRGVLGILQTPTDDAFFAKLKERWKVWHSGARTGKDGKPVRNKTSPLAKDTESLEEARKALAGLEDEWAKHERLLARAEYLEAQQAGLRSELDSQRQTVERLTTARDDSEARRTAFVTAVREMERAGNDVAAAQQRLTARTDAEARLQQARVRAEKVAEQAVENATRLASARQHLEETRTQIQNTRLQQRQLRREVTAVATGLELLQQRRELAALLATQDAVRTLTAQIERTLQRDAEEPAPSKKTLQTLTENRNQARRLQARLEAAATTLHLQALSNQSATLQVDEAAATVVGSSVHLVRRNAAIDIPAWGRILIARGAEDGTQDDTEAQLATLDTEFRNATATFGVRGDDPATLDLLRQRAAEAAVRATERGVYEGQLTKLCKDPEVLQTEIRRRQAAIATQDTSRDHESEETLQTRQQTLTEQSDGLETEVEALEAEAARQNELIDAKPHGLVATAGAAAEALAAAKATVKAITDELDRLSSRELLEQQRAEAEAAFATAQGARTAAELSEEEKELPELLRDAAGTYAEMNSRQQELLRELHTLQGALSQSAGLHQRRAEAAAVVEVLAERTARAERDAQAFHRLYEVFEECREKQTAVVTAPITSRVLRWMKLAGITDYDVMDCGPNFLPERFTTAATARGMVLDHESTGAREMIGLMVRLALGTVLVPPGESAVAVLDDPLTHCDTLRMSRMRSVLKAAAAGDATSSPPAGPLQILTFTCHPDRFVTEGAHSIDLGNPQILERI